MGEKYLGKMVQVLLVVGIILIIMGALLNITKDPLIWGTGIVTVLFMILLFRIDPLSPNE
jgi:hypothetical protein